MAAPTVIKWTDSGAPTLSRAASSLIGVLDYCLPQRGWVKEFSGTDKAVYRAGSGTERKFYRVLNDGSFYYSAVSYQYCHAKITAYDSMVDVDTGAGQWGETYFPLSASGTAVPRPWMCIFDETAMLLITVPHQTTGLAIGTVNSQITGFGDTIPALPGQTPRAFLSGQLYQGNIFDPTYSHGSLSCPGTYASIYNRMHCNRSLDGTRASVITGLIVNGGHPGVAHPTHYPFGLNSGAVLPYPYNGELLYGRPLIDDGIANSMGDYIPGLYYPCHKGSSFGNWGEYTSLGGISFIAVKVVTCTYTIAISQDIYRGVVMINTTDWAV